MSITNVNETPAAQPDTQPVTVIEQEPSMDAALELIKAEIANRRQTLAALNESKRLTYEWARDLYKEAAFRMGIDLGDPTDEQLDALHDAIGWGEFEDEYDAVLSTEPVGQ